MTLPACTAAPQRIGGALRRNVRADERDRSRHACNAQHVSELSDDRMETTSLSRDVVETEPIVLRESSTRRLVFLPALVARQHPLRGSFVYQRKRAGEAWEDVHGESLNSLRSGEGWCLELHAEEVSMLMEGLQSRKALYERHGIQWAHASTSTRTACPSSFKVSLTRRERAR